MCLRSPIALLLVGQVFCSSAQLTLLDPTFGNAGIVQQGLNGFGGDRANDVSMMPDGRIVVAATSGGQEGAMVVMRILENGVLDNSFNGTGIADVNFGSTSSGEAIALQADGRIVVAGSAFFEGSFDDLAFARFKENGALDTSFSEDGRFTVTRSGAADAVLSLTVASDGRIVAGGKFDGPVGDMAAVQLLANGNLDPSFGSNGIFETSLHTGEVSQDLVLKQDGRIALAGGWRLALPDADLAILQLNADGTVDQGYGVDGLFRPSEVGYTTVVLSASERNDGRIVLLGIRYVSGFGGQQQLFTGQVTENGEWDTGYGSGGRTFLPVGAPYVGFARDMALLADGKCLVTVDVIDTTTNASAIMVMRTMPDGGLDLAFGNNGRVVMPCPGGDCSIRALAVDAQQRVTAVGTYNTIDGTEVMVMRWLAEPSFVGFEERRANSTFSVYPVPCSEVISVEARDGFPVDAQLRLIDMCGRTVLEFPAERNGDQQFMIPSSLPNGTYALCLTSTAVVGNERVVVQR
ncbi:MAG: hypothetical protein IPO90_04785 [Flavobacteriales bacterium]|nr:hypothetical protein [Flavobacteriales bacterium]